MRLKSCGRLFPSVITPDAVAHKIDREKRRHFERRKEMDEYLDKRRALLTGLSPLGLDSRPKRQSFTRTSPHTCSGCDLTITEEDCIKGAYKISLGTVSSAILAAAAGCAFFEWVVDLLVWPASEDAHRTFKPTKQHVLYLDFPDAGSDEPFVSVTCGDGQGASGAVRLHERGWWTGRLFVCAMVGELTQPPSPGRYVCLNVEEVIPPLEPSRLGHMSPMSRQRKACSLLGAA